jgi:hypothetical protein
MRWHHETSAEDLGPGEWFVVGTPAPGSSASLTGTGTDGVDAIRAIDPAFDADAFVAWAGSVYQRAIAAWRDKSPELLRPVMAQQVWDRYAQYLLTASTVALARKLMSAAEATAALAGADADGHSQSTTVCFAVTIAAAQASLIDERARRWQERWLFQRPAGSRTHVSGSVAVCPVCGAPADPAESGRCPYCHSDITTRTAGWLITQVATTMHGAARFGGRQDPAAPRAGTPLQPPRA